MKECNICGKVCSQLGMYQHSASHKRAAAKLQKRIDELEVLQKTPGRWFWSHEDKELFRLKAEIKLHV